MNRRAQALLIKAGAFMLGALLNYACLRLVGSTGFDNLVFLVPPCSRSRRWSSLPISICSASS